MFKRNFERLCNMRGKSPTAVCVELGLSHSVYSLWADSTVPRRATLQKIADYFGVTPEELLQDENNKNAITVDTPISADMSTKISPIAHAFSSQEQMLIDAYRAVSDEGKMRMIQAVLNIKDQYSESVPVYRVARSTDDRPPKVEMLSKSDLDKLKNAPKVTSDDDL